MIKKTKVFSLIMVLAVFLAGCKTQVKNVVINSSSSTVISDKINNQDAQREIILTGTNNREYQKDELRLVDKYKQAISNEPDLNETNILAVINKWYFEIYPFGSKRANTFVLASLMDPYTFEWAKTVKAELDKESNIEDKVNTLQEWITENLVHTQSGYFTYMSGRDPWGIRDSYPGYPTYKAETPSEMKALSIYTGKNTGKCNSLALTNADIMLLLGVSPDDIVQFILNEYGENHVICFAKFEGRILYFDNTGVALVGDNGIGVRKHVIGILNYSINQYKEFEIIGKFYNDKDSLIKSVIEFAESSEDTLENKVDIVYQFKNRNDLVSTILINSENSELFALTKYAYQSLYVKRPELYLAASMRTSRARDLADELKSPDKIFNWIKTNITTGSIFEDSDDRIMTADEVIACKKGSLKDQAVLAFTLLKHKGFDPTISICKDNAYITFDNDTYEAKNWNNVQSIKDKVLLQLTLR